MNIEDEVDALNFGIEKSMRYHQRRKAFFDTSHRFTMFGVILSGSVSFANFYYISGLVATFLGTLDLVVGFSAKARDHDLLYQKFCDLARQVRKKTSPAEDDIVRWRDDRLAIEADEPPTLCALEADCWDEVRRAWGRKGYSPVLLWKHRYFMHFARFEQSKFEPELGLLHH
jgi:hypothetical protein